MICTFPPDDRLGLALALFGAAQLVIYVIKFIRYKPY
jgi:hypothetical protein